MGEQRFQRPLALNPDLYPEGDAATVTGLPAIAGRANSVGQI
jgi:hypothetical protein